ncbi:MAG TPA: glycosyltransferase [Planctomycetota bacterium]|nr:glycosyltransferase [Planctomycetota bacterium]
MRRILRVVARMNVGGPARQVIELARGLAPRGYETVVATGTPEVSEGDLRPEAERRGIRVVTIRGLGARVRAFSDARALGELTAFVRRERPDVVHTHTAKAGALGRTAAVLAASGARRVHTFHGTVFEDYFSPAKSRWVVRAERALARLAHRIVAVSHATADELEAAGIPGEKVRVIEPVVDLEPYLAVDARDGSLRRELGVADDELLVGLVGRLVPIKDPAAFVEAAAIVAKAHARARFVIVGDGPLAGELRELAAARGLAPRLALAGARVDMPRVYSDLDVVASSSRREGMPVALLEASAAARPIVATRVGGTPEIVAEQRSGFLVDPGDPAALAGAIGSMLEAGDAFRRTMGGVGRTRAGGKFGRERGLDRHAQLYAELGV